MRWFLGKLFEKKYVELFRYKDCGDYLGNIRLVGRKKKEIDSCLDYYFRNEFICEKYPKSSVLRKSRNIKVSFSCEDLMFDENEIVKEDFEGIEFRVSPCAYALVLNQVEMYEGGMNKRGDLFEWYFGNGLIYLPENVNDAILDGNWFKHACDVYVAQEKKYGWIDDLERKFKF